MGLGHEGGEEIGSEFYVTEATVLAGDVGVTAFTV